jgi:hypothetical protein
LIPAKEDVMQNLVRVSKANIENLPVRGSTLYKWKHLNKNPQIFIKLGGFLFVDVEELYKLLESGRQQ